MRTLNTYLKNDPVCPFLKKITRFSKGLIFISSCLFQQSIYADTQPLASCQDITVSVGLDCTAMITAQDIDNGSIDPDGNPITLSIDNNGPLDLGTHTVTLTVSNGNHEATCTANVTIHDLTAPTISCPPSISANEDNNSGGAVVYYADPTASDNCLVIPYVNFKSGQPNNGGNNEEEDHLIFLQNGKWNDKDGTKKKISIVEFTSITNTNFNHYTKIGDFNGHSYYVFDKKKKWIKAKTKAENIGAQLCSINSQEENNFLTNCNLNEAAWIGGFQDTTDPNYIEPGNESQNFGGWKWLDGTIFGGQPIITQTLGLSSGSIFPVGITTNTFRATDANGNHTECSFDITIIQQNNPPIALCQAYTVEVGMDCTASIAASDVNYNSSDPDGDNLILTLDNTGPFVIGVHAVILTVSDGEFSDDCTAMVTVIDNTPPTLQCPADMTIACTQLDDNIDFGDPIVNDNCGYGLDSIIVEDIDDCGAGSIIRTFIVSSSSGTVAICNQMITVVNPMVFDQNSVTTPADVVLTQCNPDTSVNALGSLSVTGDLCGNIWILHADAVADTYGACILYQRTWQVMNACDVNAQYTYVQNILVKNNAAPVINVPNDITVNVGANCLASYDPPAVTFDTCSTNVTITNDYNNEGGNISNVTFPQGTTVVTYTATDDCGQSSSYTSTVTVIGINSDDDFYIADQTAPPTASAGSNIIVKTKQYYDGLSTTSLKSYVGYYFSTDQTWDGSDILMGEDYSTLSATDPYDPEVEHVTIPLSALQGPAYILFVADHRTDFMEYNECNNVAYVPIMILETIILPDNFYMSHEASNKSQAEPGEKVKLSCRQNYEGSSTTGLKVYMKYYLSLDNIVSVDDIVLASDMSKLKITDLWDTEKATVRIPAGTPYGLYKLLFWSDSPETYSEPNEIDNLRFLDIIIGYPVQNRIADNELDVLDHIPLGIIEDSKEEQIEELKVEEEMLSTLLDFQAYPNPSAGAFIVSSRTIPGITSACDLRIIDVNGRIVYETIYKIGTEQRLDLTNINANGIYHMLIQNETGMIHEQRLMIIR